MRLAIITFYKLKMMISDRLFFAAMIIIPLFITISTGYALRHEKLNIIPVAVVDEDNTDYSRTLIERLSKKEGFRVEALAGKRAIELLKGNSVEAVFIIKKGFQEKLIKGENQGIIDIANSPSSFSADFIGEVVAGEVIRFTSGNMAADWVLKKYKELGKPTDKNFRDEVIRYTDLQWEPKPLMTVNYTEIEGSVLKTVKRASMPAATASSAGIIVVFIMFYVLFSSGWLIEERNNGTLKRLVSGANALRLSFAGNILALAISSVFQIAVFTLINKLVFGVDLFPGMWAYVIFGAYLFSVISISLFLSSILRTPAQLQAGAPVFALLTGFAGGCFWNFVEMAEPIKRLSLLTPQGWALEGINRLLSQPGNIQAVIMPIMILMGISLLLMPVSYFYISRSVSK